MISRNKAAVLTAAVCILVMALAGTTVLAEISAKFDRQGNYIRMIYLTNASNKNLRIWSAFRNGRESIVPLNPEGDALMDSWPYYMENPFEGNRPYVVWSRFNGYDYDLVWTRLLDGEWAQVDWVEQVAHPGMEQDPYMVSHPKNGRPHLVWWSDEDGIGRVYLSVFLETGWMERFLVSDPDVDSRYPVIDILEDEQIRVTYHTPDGTVSQIFTFNVPDGLRDDADPTTDMGKDDREFRQKDTY